MRIHLIALLSSDTTGYRLLLIGHLLCAIIGFGSTFVYPFMGAEAGKRKGVEGAAISDAVMKTASIVTAPFIYGAGIFGLLLVAFGPYDWGDRWLQIAIPLLAAAILFSAFVHVPNLEAMNRLSHELVSMGPPPAGASGPPPQAVEIEKRGAAAARNGGLLHLAFAVVLVLMVWKPM
jgi:hypothetical protein